MSNGEDTRGSICPILIPFVSHYPHRYHGLESWMLAGRLMQHEYSARRDVLDFSKGGIEM